MGDFIIIGAAVFYTTVCLVYLVRPSLWLDESVEYWYSKVLVGPIPFNGFNCVDSTNMYQRIISTFQPPLYNMLMYVWLRIFDTQTWFRLFGVISGAFGMWGIYRIIEILTESKLFSSLALLATTSVYYFVYFWTEASEYCLVMTFVIWLLLSYINTLKHYSVKNVLFFCLFSVLAVYSQYGAAFPVVALSFWLVIYKVKNHERTEEIKTIVALLSTALIAGLPLLSFFAIPQIKNQPLAYGTKQVSSLINMIISFPIGVVKTFRHAFHVSILGSIIVTVCFTLIVFLIVFKIKGIGRTITFLTLVTWLIYYCTTLTGLYTGFGGRHGCFMLPLIWIVILYGLYLSAEYLEKRTKRFKNVFIVLCVAFFSFCYLRNCITGWEKEDIRTTVDDWYVQQTDMENASTFVYYAADSGFLYYLRHSKQYDPSLEESIKLMDWDRDQTVPYYLDLIASMYDYEKPSNILFVTQHPADDISRIMEAFNLYGYDIARKTEKFGSDLIQLTNREDF